MGDVKSGWGVTYLGYSLFRMEPKSQIMPSAKLSVPYCPQLMNAPGSESPRPQLVT